MANGTYYHDGEGWKRTHDRPPLRRPNGAPSVDNVAQDCFLLKSPNGTVWKIVATDAGQLQTVSVAGL